MVAPDELEGAADEVLEATGTSAPVDAFALARACGFEIRAAPDVVRAERREDVILLDPRMRPERQHMQVCHELGHFTLERHGLPDTEASARYVGGALLMPRRELDRDLTRTAWSIPRLRELHVHASATALAVRITQLRDAVATVLDMGGRRRPWRIVSPWLPESDPRRRVTTFERELAARAIAEGGEARDDLADLCYAVPLIEHGYQYAIVVCELEQLSLRLA